MGHFRYRDGWEQLLRRRRIEGDCWIWTGWQRARGSNGRGEPYGGVQYQDKAWLVHRLAVTLASGPIPSGMMVDHLCKRTLCFNPDHLRVVTAKANAAGRDQEQLKANLKRALAARLAA